MTIEAYKYQKEGVRAMEDFLAAGQGVGLFDDMGLGKTMQTLWLLRRARVGDMFPALVVCPASVKYMWEHEALRNAHIRPAVLEGRTPPRGKFDLTPALMIINPDILVPWLPHLLDMGLRTLILDESQTFGNLTSQRTRAAITLAREVQYRVALSGTPLTNRPAELWPTLHMLRPDIFPSFFSFAQEYCKPKREYGKWTYKGAQNIPQLHALLKDTCMVRRLKEDVLHDLPNKIRRVVPINITNPDEYNEARDNFVTWLQKNYTKGRVNAALRAAAVTQIGYLLRLAARLKCRAVVERANKFLEEYPNKKLVLFAVHHKMIEVLQRRVNAKSTTVDGRVTGRRRKLAVDVFRRDPECRVFIGNIRAAGTGVDGLQDVCSDMMFTELWWRPGDHIQAEDRLYRIGQGGHVWIEYLVAHGTIDEHLCRVIQKKQKVIRNTLDGKASSDDIAVFDQLFEALSIEKGDTK